MPIMANTADIVNWWLYDRNVVAAGANTGARIVYFNVPIGGAGKTKEDTNLEQVQRLADPQWMNVTHIGFFFHPNMFKVDIDLFLADYYYEFWVGQKVYIEGPLQCAPGGAGMYGFDTRNNEAGISNGMPLLSNMMDLRLPAGADIGTDVASGVNVVANGITGIQILQGQSFHVDVIGTPVAMNALGTGLNLMCYLYGILSRAVQ